MSIQKKEDDEEALRSVLLVRIEPALEVNLKALTGAGASV